MIVQTIAVTDKPTNRERVMRKQELKDRRDQRLSAIREYVEKAIDRQLLPKELSSLHKLNDQDVHLLVATMDEMS